MNEFIHILHNNNELQLKKVCAKWVSRKLSADHKANRVEISKQLLEVLGKIYTNIIILLGSYWICLIKIHDQNFSTTPCVLTT